MSNQRFVSYRFLPTYGTSYPHAAIAVQAYDVDLMVAVTGIPLGYPFMSDGLRSWSFGLFDCFADLPTCISLPVATGSSCWLTVNIRRPGNVLLQLRLLAKQAAVHPP